MYCIDCGQPQALKQARFCAFCGTALHRPGPVVGDSLTDQVPHGEVPPASGGVDTPQPKDAALPPAQPPAPAAIDLKPGLDPARWIPLPGQVPRLRQRLRWAIAGAVVVLFVAAGGGYVWWTHLQVEQEADERIEVERVDAAASEPAAAEPAASKPRP